ncbi:hypothetical protein BPS15Q2_93 [Salmonella phage BPS15Q2]|uniref:Uncharacterized protein n=1 Tax=Salmonella phage BPS15Q2 TaxID=1857100 RepID=A0A1B1PE61_9CAUD|nr:hypothetical protein BPS15Q2_93 [Salmonella phage BPS15Q2]ANT42449.1 hypothetical protein BPS15Q2_93 [Salmonella phage BPS15Q2]
MGGKVIVNGEQSSIAGLYTYNSELLDEWTKFTSDNHGKGGLESLACIVGAGVFLVLDEKFGEYHKTNLFCGMWRVGITPEELTKFCIKV